MRRFREIIQDIKAPSTSDLWINNEELKYWDGEWKKLGGDSKEEENDKKYSFMGTATPSTNPGQSTEKVYYVANTPGTYIHFDSLSLIEGETALLMWDTAWSKYVITSNPDNPILGGSSLSDFIYDVNVSKLYPTEGIGGKNTYTLEGAITKVPEELKTTGIGLTISFINADNKFVQYRYKKGVNTSNPVYWEEVVTKEYIDNILSDSLAYTPIKASVGKKITSSGELADYGGACYTDFIPLDSCVILKNISSIAGDIAVVSFYTEGKEFIPEYNSYLGNYSSSVMIYNCVISPSQYPKASFCRVSYSGSSLSPVIAQVIDTGKVAQSNLDKLLHVSTVSCDYKKNGGKVIKPNGSLVGWGTGFYTDLINITDSYVEIKNLKTVATSIRSVSFYNKDKEFIASYGSFDTTLVQTLNLSFYSSDYPDAQYIKVSGDTGSTDLSIKKYNVKSYIERLSNLEKNFSNANFSTGNPIYGIGDSIGSQILAALAANIVEVDGHQIINGCIGGETVLDSLGKNNIIPYVVLPFTIPAETTQSGALTIYSSRYLKTSIAEDGTTLSYSNVYRVGEAGSQSNPFGEGILPWDTLKCTIGGIKGTLYFTRSNPNRANNYFIRDEAGEEVVFDRPQLVIPTELKNKNSIWVAFLGTNGGWIPADAYDDFNRSADVLVNYYKQLRDYIGHDNYVFLGFYSTAYIDQTTGPTRIERWKYFEDRMIEEFGKHYLSVRQYLREYGWRDAGYQLGYRLVKEEGNNHYTCLEENITEDKQAIADGRIPYCIVNGPSGVHMLARPSACVANQVIKRLYELGSISLCPQIDVSKITDAENADINQPDYGA